VAEWRIEPLRASHERGEFSCGKAPLDDFLRLRASQYEKRRLGRTYVALFPGATRVAGYYTLAAGAVAVANLPSEAAKRLPKHPVPVILLGRLAVDQKARGQGLGKALLRDALRRSLDLSEQLGLFAVEVLATDADAREFYTKYGFVPLADNDLHLFLPIRTIEEGTTEGKSEAGGQPGGTSPNVPDGPCDL
jgi:GNAT superfamily N-acetyltransferase